MRLLLAPVLLLSSIVPVTAEPEGIPANPDGLWTGPYVGINAGVGAGAIRLTAHPSPEAFAYFPPLSSEDAASLIHSARDEDASLFGGFHLGYNMPVGQLVLGVEADFNAGNMAVREQSQTSIATLYSVGFPPGMDPVETRFTYSTSIEGRVDWLASSRLRLGFAPTDRLLVYGTGGLALAGTQSRFSAELVPAGALLPEQVLARYQRDSSRTRIGGVLGAGLEYALSDRVSVRLEYMHTRLTGAVSSVRPDDSDRFIYPLPGVGSPTAATDDPGYPPPLHPDAVVTIREQSSFNILRVGLSYRF